MKKLVPILLVLFCSCAGKEKNYQPATDALDAGREYINATMEGDFDKAAFYIIQDEKNKVVLAGIEKAYREKDKEGRQQLRTASININGVKSMGDSSTEINYNYSFDKQPRALTVVKKQGNWLVDLGRN